MASLFRTQLPRTVLASAAPRRAAAFASRPPTSAELHDGQDSVYDAKINARPPPVPKAPRSSKFEDTWSEPTPSASSSSTRSAYGAARAAAGLASPPSSTSSSASPSAAASDASKSARQQNNNGSKPLQPPNEPQDATVPHYYMYKQAERSDPLCDFWINLVMKHGEKLKAQILLHKVLEQISAMTQSPPLPIFKAAIVAAAPMLAISSEKKGAKMLYTPVGLTERQRIRQSITWILESTDKRPQRSFEKRHATELLSILDGTSPVLEKLDQRHKMGMINRSMVKTPAR